MKAAIRTKYGSPGVLTIKEIEKPIPGDNEILIRVYAAAVSRTDCHILTGKPFYMHFFTGFFKPRFATTGTDFAGQVESVGKNVTAFKPGDKVMGFEFLGLQSHGDYIVLKDTKPVVPIPVNLNYNEAAACIEGAFYALNGIKALNIQTGQKALVFGATGAIGTSYLQFFDYYGVTITAVCGSENSDLVRSLGAHKIIDYKTQDFTKDPEKYDFVIDAIGRSSFRKCKPLLKERGIFSSSGGLENLFLAMITSIRGGKKVLFSAPKDLRECLLFIKDLAEKEKFKPVIDRIYPLHQIAEAFTYVMSGQKVGNVILSME